jgi:hypothetical protein
MAEPLPKSHARPAPDHRSRQEWEANPELGPAFVLGSLERSADIVDGLFAIFIQLL